VCWIVDRLSIPISCDVHTKQHFILIVDAWIHAMSKVDSLLSCNVKDPSISRQNLHLRPTPLSKSALISFLPSQP
jgi:hypothetical protein